MNTSNQSHQDGQKNDMRIQSLLSKLRQKLKDLVVLDQQAIVLGNIQDVVLNPAKQLQLKIKLFPSDQNLPILTVGSKYIQRVDMAKNALFLDVSKAEIFMMINPSSHSFDSSTSSETLNEQNPLEINDTVDFNFLEDSDDMPQVITEEIVRLLEERLVVDTQRRKVGEVIVRKEITTEIVEVPVRREKLIVEQVSPSHKQLAEIDLGGKNRLELALDKLGLEDNMHGDYINEAGVNPAFHPADFAVTGEFSSLRTAASLLNAIALETKVQCRAVRVQLILEDAEQQKTYQEWFDRCSRPIPRQ